MDLQPVRVDVRAERIEEVEHVSVPVSLVLLWVSANGIIASVILRGCKVVPLLDLCLNLYLKNHVG